MYTNAFIGCCIFLGLACNSTTKNQYHTPPLSSSMITPAVTADCPYDRLQDIPLPKGYQRLATGKGSFGEWLLQIGLKKSNIVHLYNGTVKPNQHAQFAALDIPVGKKNLQQCADAVMRLRASFLYDVGKYEEIYFADNNGKGYRFSPPYTKQHFEQFLERVFGMCGTASLEKQLTRKKIRQVVAGDVLIRGGFPGHTVMVMDVAINAVGQKIYLLAQSYMPAQDIHLLKNPADATLSPWYTVTEAWMIVTPEYHFTRNELSTW